MLEELLARHCAPTLAGIKTGSLFACDSVPELPEKLRVLGGRLAPRGLRVLTLRDRGGRALLYVYRPRMLGPDLARPAARRILSPRGYLPRDQAQCLSRLRDRLSDGGEFPHEIGLFLGYPPEDVSGFIGGRRCKTSGLWKVYGDPDAARAVFERYKACSAVCRALLSCGVPIEILAVPANRAEPRPPE